MQLKPYLLYIMIAALMMGCTDSGGQKVIDNLMIQPIADCVYDGQVQSPDVVVKYSDNLVDGRVYVLEPGHDYTVSYENNVEVGTATVIVTAADGNYSGEVKATFNIVGTTAIGAVAGDATTAAKHYDLGGRKAGTKRSAEGRLYPQGLKKGVVIVDDKKILKR